jgi:pimeloyl-ACP methyl ester carboxylesterase
MRGVFLAACCLVFAGAPALGGESAFRARASYRPNDAGRPTVCLVHGMNSTSGSFVHMIPLLEAAGFGVVVYDYPFNRDLDRLAPGFVRDWRAFRKQADERRAWAVVTHSMGALLARWYVEGDGYGGDVSDLVMIAPPNEGSAVARAQTLIQIIEAAQSASNGKRAGRAQFAEGLGEAADDLLPGSAFLKALNARPRRQGVRYSILAGDRGFLTPEDRARVEGRLGVVMRSNGFLGGLSRLAAGDVKRQLDELTDGTGDGCVSVASSRLAGVTDHQTLPADHVTLIRGPLFYPDPGPVVCMTFVLDRLGPARGEGEPLPAAR